MRSHSLDAALKALATQYTATVPAETLALFPRWHGELLPAITEQEPPEIRARIDELEEAARRSSTPESALGYIFSINALQAALDIHEFYGRGSSAGSASATASRLPARLPCALSWLPQPPLMVIDRLARLTQACCQRPPPRPSNAWPAATNPSSSFAG